MGFQKERRSEGGRKAYFEGACESKEVKKSDAIIRALLKLFYHNTFYYEIHFPLFELVYFQFYLFN